MFYWKGIASTTKKIVVSEQPMITKAKRRIERIDIPGRSGFLTIDEGTYESIVISIECHFKTDADQDDILSWLDGSGKLSLDGIREYDAVIVNDIPLKKVTNIFREFVVKFECQPIAKDITDTVAYITNNPQTLSILDSTGNMYPTLEITGTGDVTITVNGNTFNLYDMDQKYTLDCDLKVITNASGDNIANKMLHDFPLLIPGDNVISTIGTISEFKITYNKSYL